MSYSSVRVTEPKPEAEDAPAGHDMKPKVGNMRSLNWEARQGWARDKKVFDKQRLFDTLRFREETTTFADKQFQQVREAVNAWPGTSTPAPTPKAPSAVLPTPVFTGEAKQQPGDDTIPWERKASRQTQEKVRNKARHHHHSVKMSSPHHHHLHFQPQTHYHIPAPYAYNPYPGVYTGPACWEPLPASTRTHLLDNPPHEVFGCSKPAKKKPRRASSNCRVTFKCESPDFTKEDCSSSSDEDCGEAMKRITRAELRRNKKFH